MSIVLSTIPQFIFEYFCIYLIKVKHNPDKASENCSLLSYQFLIVIIYCYLILHSMHDLILVGGYGRVEMFFFTFLTALLLDHLKSFITLPLLYCIVVRRFMHL
jgi:hypothetical protein